LASKEKVIENLTYFQDELESIDNKSDLMDLEEKFTFSEDILKEYVKDHLKSEGDRAVEYRAAQSIIGYNKLLFIRLLLKKKKFKKAKEILESFDKSINHITYFQSYLAYIFYKNKVSDNLIDKFEATFDKVIKSSVWNLEYFINISYFEEIENLDNEDDKFLLLIFSFLVLRFLYLLNVEFDDEIERKVAHFTDVNVARLLVNGKTQIRLSSTEFMNDPKEGELFFDIFGLKKFRDELNYEQSFLACFTFNHNSLNQFRLYGKLEEKECTGLSLVVNKNFFSKMTNRYDDQKSKGLPLFRCVYIDPISKHIELAKRNKFSFYQEFSSGEKAKSQQEIEDMWISYNEKITKTEKVLSKILMDMEVIVSELDLEKIKLLKHINHLIQPIRFLFKHFAFQEEQECRILEICSLSDTKVEADFESAKTYINYPLKIEDYLTNVYIGKALEKKSVCLTKEILSLQLKGNPKVKLTDNPFRLKE